MMKHLKAIFTMLAMLCIFIAFTIFSNFITNGSYDMSQIGEGAVFVCIGIFIWMLQSLLEEH